MRYSLYFMFLWLAALLMSGAFPTTSQESAENSALDKKVSAFIDKHRTGWRDLNVPESDGKVLYDIIIKNGYTRALEVGTSTGRSGIWIAWALSKTGGKLITIEIDRERHQQAVENFRAAGLEKFIDARLGDAHDLVPELEGPFDFVFVDADKTWYKRYLELLLPKLTDGGCFTAHNVTNSLTGIREFLDYLKETPSLETTIDRSSGSGISVSYKKKK